MLIGTQGGWSPWALSQGSEEAGNACFQTLTSQAHPRAADQVGKHVSGVETFHIQTTLSDTVCPTCTIGSQFHQGTRRARHPATEKQNWDCRV